MRFSYDHKPKVAQKGKEVTQLYYAKQGIITPEMEYVAIRENQRIEQLESVSKEMAFQHPGHSFGANTPKSKITPEFVKGTKLLREERSFPIISTTSESEPMIIGRNFW